MKYFMPLLFLLLIGSSITVFAQGDSEPEQKSNLEIVDQELSIEYLKLDVLSDQFLIVQQVNDHNASPEQSYYSKADRKNKRLDKLFKRADKAFDHKYKHQLKKIRNVTYILETPRRCLAPPND